MAHRPLTASPPAGTLAHLSRCHASCTWTRWPSRDAALADERVSRSRAWMAAPNTDPHLPSHSASSVQGPLYGCSSSLWVGLKLQRTVPLVLDQFHKPRQTLEAPIGRHFRPSSSQYATHSKPGHGHSICGEQQLIRVGGTTTDCTSSRIYLLVLQSAGVADFSTLQRTMGADTQMLVCHRLRPPLMPRPSVP